MRKFFRKFLSHRKEWLSRKSFPASSGIDTFLPVPSCQEESPSIVSASIDVTPNFLNASARNVLPAPDGPKSRVFNLLSITTLRGSTYEE